MLSFEFVRKNQGVYSENQLLECGQKRMHRIRSWSGIAWLKSMQGRCVACALLAWTHVCLHGYEPAPYQAAILYIILETQHASLLAACKWLRHALEVGAVRSRCSNVFLGRVWVVVGVIVYVDSNPLSSTSLWALCKRKLIMARRPPDGTRSTADTQSFCMQISLEWHIVHELHHFGDVFS